MFVAKVSAAGPTPDEQKLTADAITSALVQRFVASQPSPLTGDYVLVWTDPVDFVLTDASARSVGFTAGRGPISEVGGSYNSGGGVLKLAILPLLSSSYNLTLIGVGEGSVLFGAAEITAAGVQVEAQTTSAPGLPVSLQSMKDLVVVLGFNHSSTPAPPPPIVSHEQQNDPGSTTSSTAAAPSTSVSSSFSAPASSL